MLTGRRLPMRVLLGAAGAVYLYLAGGCATHRPFHHRPGTAGEGGAADEPHATGGTSAARGGVGGTSGAAGKPAAGTSGTANAEGGEGGTPDHAPNCKTGAFRCLGNVPQQCTDDAWSDQTPCTGATPVCVAATGECTSVPKSAVEFVAGATVVSGGPFSAEVQVGSGIAPTRASGGPYQLYGSAVIDPSTQAP